MSPLPPRLRLRTGDLSVRYLDDAAVLLDLRSSKYLKVNASGSFLLQVLASEHSPVELVAALMERFEVDLATAERDVDAFLAELSRLGLLEDE